MPFHVNGSLTVAADRSLTLVPGTVLKFLDGAYIQALGTLHAVGTLTKPVVLTSDHDDSVGGDSNNDADQTVPGQGDWEGVYLDSPGSQLVRVDIRYAGDSNGTFGGGETSSLHVRSDAIVRNVRVLHGKSTGIYVTTGTPLLEEVHLEGNGFEAIFLELAAVPTLRGITAVNNRFNRIGIRDGTFPQSDRTLDAGGDLPFHPTGSWTLAAGSTLRLLPGTVVKFLAGSFLDVNGTMQAQATADAPIILTSVKRRRIRGRLEW